LRCILKTIFSALVILHTGTLIGWAVARRLTGDRFWLLALVNAFAIYLFVPLPLTATLALLSRRHAAWASLTLAIILFASLFGAELLPPTSAIHAEDSAPTLTVMTYNVLYTVEHVEPVAASITRNAPDLIAFQEFSYMRAQMLAHVIEEAYPYRTPIYHDVCYTMVAIWSRHPIVKIEEVDDDVTCRLQSVVIDLDGQLVRVINVHGWPFTGLDQGSVDLSFQWRREQFALIQDMVKDQPEPLILLGDLNSTPMSEVYATLSAHYTDSFAEAGWGFGHTFPAEGGRLWGIPYPHRMVRIDHIFHSDEWCAEEAWVGEWDGFSDHLPVIARLKLSSEK
jgi:endonuclease/exonuclease/phosphatase (EEP) superfamily protein YafD